MMKTSNDIKYYLKAETAEGIRALMASNSIKANKYYGYELFYADGYWYAWYEESADKEMMEKYDTINRRKGQRSQEV